MSDRHEFHRVEVCGRIFTGTVHAGGPCLKLLESRIFGHGVPLDHALRLSRERGRRYHAISWHGRPVITLPLFADEDVEIVAREFGIPMEHRLKHFSFAESPAWQALKEWASQHPDLARACERTRTVIARCQEAETFRMAYR